ncbi:basal body-orientation factor 1-like [Rhinoraja longicauda]
MPKKTKGKGKKDAKSDPKLSTESDAEKGKANAALWEARLNILERSRVEYRNTAQMLARANESLMNDRYQVERDAMEVISYLKKQEMEKESKISQLQQQAIDQKQQAYDENKKIIEIHTQQSDHMQTKMTQKMKEMQLIQWELNKVKSFRKKQVLLENELDDIKETMNISNKEHQETLRQLENKFFEEKIRLEREAEQRLNRLTEQAHTEAIINLDERAQCVFKENVNLHERIKIYKEEEERRRKDYKTLEDKNTLIVSEKETNELLIKEQVSDSRLQRAKINELQTKVENLEKVLGHMAAEFETAKQKMKQENELRMATSQVEIERLGALVKLKDKEMNRVKKLAKNILDERTDVEMFFLQSLEEVRQQIAYSRAQYKQAAQIAFQKKMLRAFAGKDDYPQVRTFGKNAYSTNCVYQDMEEAEHGIHAGKVSISDLTWEQKEKVLRLLFAKMNGWKANRKLNNRSQAPSESESVLTIKETEQISVQDEHPIPTFITQTPIEPVVNQINVSSDQQPSKEIKLPEIVLV